MVICLGPPAHLQHRRSQVLVFASWQGNPSRAPTSALGLSNLNGKEISGLSVLLAPAGQSPTPPCSNSPHENLKTRAPIHLAARPSPWPVRLCNCTPPFRTCVSLYCTHCLRRSYRLYLSQLLPHQRKPQPYWRPARNWHCP